MKNKLWVGLFIEFIIAISVTIVLYMYTLKLDFFPWGNSENDGLYLLGILIFFFPWVLILASLKYFILKNCIKSGIFHGRAFLIGVLISFPLWIGDINNTKLLLGIAGTIISLLFILFDFIVIIKPFGKT